MAKVSLTLMAHKHASEIFQSMDIKFSLLTRESKDIFTQVSHSIKCRDFLGDCIWSKLTGNTANIYGFSYNYKEAPYGDDKLYLSLKFPDEGSMGCFVKNLEYLHVREEMADVSKTEVFETEHKNTLVIISDAVWLTGVWKLSLFTFWLKLLSYESTNVLADPEDGYFAYLTPKIEKHLISKVNETKEVLADTISKAHNYSGFISIIKNQNKEMNQLLLGDM